MNISSQFLFFMMVAISSRLVWAQSYLPTANELRFPSEAVNSYFRLDKGDGNIIQVEQGWGFITFKESFINKPLCIADKVYEHGLGVHATSVVLIKLPKAASRFQAKVGFDYSSQTWDDAPNDMVFSVQAGEKVLWQSPQINVLDKPVFADVPLDGAKEFVLKVVSVTGSLHHCHANWADACVIYDSTEKVWLEEYAGTTAILGNTPFSFQLDGKSSRDFLGTWKYSCRDSMADDRILHQIQWEKPDGTFRIRCRLVEFTRHPAVEWKLFFKNTGTTNSPTLGKILSLDAVISEPSRLMPPNQSSSYPVIINASKGSNNSRYDFTPVAEILDLGQEFTMKSHAGRSSETFLPFWNLQNSKSGVVAALGWSGDWQADFANVMKNRTSVQAGMTNVELYLEPGEEISSPSVCLLYWEGQDALRGHNLFRRYMRDVVVPKWNGQAPVVYAMSGGASALEAVSEKNQVHYIRKMAGTGVQVYWLDAGWYAGRPGDKWHMCRGNWFPDPVKFPNGMRVLADEAHKNGLKFLLWFDPEIADNNSRIDREHPEWLIKSANRYTNLYNLGNPDALKYMTDLISKNLIDWEVDIFRNDSNIDPGLMWRSLDARGRTGITEIRYVEGLYYFWDQLLKRKSGLLIDNCASGGRRIDYETCKRSVPLWRTDYNCEPHPDVYDASQNHTFGLGLYLPYQSVGQTITYDKYKDRSLTSTSVVLTISPTKADELVQVPFDKVKSVWDDVKSYNYLMAYDFYPLTNFSMADNVWMVFQYDHPEKGEGCVICYRRKNAPFTAAVFDLRAIDEQATYKLIDIDNRTEEYVKGSELARFTVQLQPLESRVFKYLKIRS